MKATLRRLLTCDYPPTKIVIVACFYEFRVRAILCGMRPTEQVKLAVSVRDAAAMLGISSRTIQNYIAAKVLPARKIGRRTVIPMRALETFLRTDQPSPVTKPEQYRP